MTDYRRERHSYVSRAGGGVKRDVRKAGEEEDWKKKARDRGGWKRLSDEAVKKLRAAPHPCQRETRKRERELGKRGAPILSRNWWGWGAMPRIGGVGGLCYQVQSSA